MGGGSARIRTTGGKNRAGPDRVGSRTVFLVAPVWVALRSKTYGVAGLTGGQFLTHKLYAFFAARRHT